MGERNPYKVFEKVMYWSGVVFVLAFVLFLIVGGVVNLWLDGWGAWALLAIPAIPVFFIVASLVLGLIVTGFDALERQWETRKYRWEQGHRKS